MLTVGYVLFVYLIKQVKISYMNSINNYARYPLMLENG